MEASQQIQTKETVDSLWKLYQETQSNEIKNQLVMHHLPLVKFVIGRMFSYLPSHISRDDLLNSGVIGLVKAVERFDTDRNIKFSTYATTRIRGAILDELRSNDFLPRSVRGKIRELKKAIQILEGKLQRSPTEEEIANHLNIEIEDYRDLLKQLGPICFFSISESLNGGNKLDLKKKSLLPLADLENADSPTEKQELRTVLLKAIQELPKNERLMIALYYYEEMTMKEIAVVLKVSESRVSQIHTQAVMRLRGTVEKEFAQ